jgi:hypothetical protein
LNLHAQRGGRHGRRVPGHTMVTYSWGRREIVYKNGVVVLILR